jgi:hypothetical protein
LRADDPEARQWRNVEWVFLLRFLERLPQRIDVIDEQRLSPIQQIVGEKPAAVGDKCAAIIRHASE